MTRAAGLLATLVLAGTVGAPALHAADRGYSRAEQKVFLDDHLRSVGVGVDEPRVLRYLFRKSGTLEKNFDDAVVLTVKPKGRDSRTVEVSYLTGERKVTLPIVEEAKANPVILYFLESDVREMRRRLGGSENYFRKRIRVALADSDEVRPVQVVVDGRQVAASEVTIRPFAGDPMKTKLGAFENKSYVFTVSDQVPGGVVQMRSRVTADAVPGGAAAAEGVPLLEETLSFETMAK